MNNCNAIGTRDYLFFAFFFSVRDILLAIILLIFLISFIIEAIKRKDNALIFIEMCFNDALFITVKITIIMSLLMLHRRPQ